MATQLTGTEELNRARQRVQAARQELLNAGADSALIEALVAAVQDRAAATVQARHEYRNEELYPYFPESYSIESNTYTEIVELLKED